MIVLIDAGNSRIKWGVWSTGAWQGKGSVASADRAGFGACLSHIQPTWVGVSCVAGDEVRLDLTEALSRFAMPVYWLKPEVEACGVRNGYRTPASLGADRWANLLACRCLDLAPCIIASLGTAMTVDALSADGRFLGGMILPGSGLMRQSLQKGTAGVLSVEGDCVDFPVSTGDAVATGTIAAQVGAVTWLRSRLEALEGRGVNVVMTGGGAGSLLGQVAAPVRIVEDLVLEGLLCLARDQGVQGI
jgi:type III pantothenate kinase